MSDSINSYTSSRAVLALLKPTVSWGQVRADRDRQLQYQAAITQDAQAKQAESEQAASATQQAMSSLYDVPFLEQDQNRWKDFVDTMLSDNDKRITTEYGNDRERYAKERYKQDVQNMVMKATKSPLFKASLKRRADLVQLMADQSKGLIDRSVTYKLADGTIKTAPATQNYLDFQNGKTTDFTYAGGYQQPTKFRKFFSDNYHPDSASDPNGKFKVYQANGFDVKGRLMTEDALSDADSTDYLTRFGPRLGPINWKFDPRDPYREAGIKQRDRALAQGDVRNSIAKQNANTSAAKVKLDKKAMEGFNAYGITIDPRNIRTVDANGTPMSIPGTVYDEGKAEATPWSLTGYDSQLIQPQLMAQLGIKQQKVKGGGITYSRGNLGEVFVKVPNDQGGFDLRKTDISRLNYQVVAAGDLYRRNLADGEKTVYEKNGGPEKLYPEFVIRIKADEALKQKKNKLFDNVFAFMGLDKAGGIGNVDSKISAGAYREVKEKGETYYDFPIITPLIPTAATRIQMENTNPGRYLDSKAGSSSMSDYNNEGPAISDNIFDYLENTYD